MKDIFKIAAMVFGFIALIWAIAGNQLAMSAFFNPKFEQVRRETFEQSKAYQDGTLQEIRSMQFEYAKAAPNQKQMLGEIIKHKLAGFPEDKIPADLKVFVATL